MAMIDILKLNEELDKMIEVQEKEIRQIDEKIKANNEEKWRVVCADLTDCFNAFNAIGVDDDIYVPLFTYKNVFLEMRFSSYGGIVIEHNERRCISSYITPSNTFERNCSATYRNRFHIAAINDRWAEIRERFMHDFESACVEALKKKAEKANAKYQAALDRRVQ